MVHPPVMATSTIPANRTDRIMTTRIVTPQPPSAAPRIMPHTLSGHDGLSTGGRERCLAGGG
jgi:hypothetical protein